MRTMQIALGCVAAAALLVLPALAAAETAGKTSSPAATGKAAAPLTAKAPARPAGPVPVTAAPEGSTGPAVPLLPPAPPPPALEPLPPLPPMPSATPPGATPPSMVSTPAPASPAALLAPSKGPAPAAALPLPPFKSATSEAAEPLPTPPKPAFPYSGHINSDAVRIRSGPGLYYYQLALLNSGATVVVENEADGWLALRPTSGVFGLVKKSDLAIAPDGKKASVSAAAARIYAASEAANNRHWSVMATLKQGDTVQVLGPGEGDLVKIVPPEGAHVYVMAQYVQAGAGAGGVDAALTVEPPKVDPLVEDFKKADSALTVEQKKPLGQRDFAAVTAAYKDIAEKTDKAYLRRAAEGRLAFIQGLARQQDGYLKVMAISDQLDKNLAEIRAQEAAKTAQAEREQKLTKAEFVATGLVAPLETMEEVDYPIKYKLVDQKGHPLVVLKSSTYDLSKYVGKIVGVRGAKTYLKDWRIYLVTVDDLEVIE